MAQRPSFWRLVAKGGGNVVSAARNALSNLGSAGSALSRAVGLSNRSVSSRVKHDISVDVLKALDKSGQSIPIAKPTGRTVPRAYPIAKPTGRTPPPAPRAYPPQRSQTSTRTAGGLQEPPQRPLKTEDGYDNVEQLPRAEYPRLPEKDVFTAESWRYTYGSSNVYAIAYQQTDRRSGILYVRFQNWAPGMGYDSGGPGPVYAYYDVSVAKWQQFKAAARDSAGGAVWDYLRIRGTDSGHQHQYTLQEGGIGADGNTYVPRKVTPRGLRQRALAAPGTGRRGYIRSQLPEQINDNGRPDRGRPDRGEPNRGF